MTAAVPDPRFRDQLAEALWTNDNPGAGPWTDVGGLTRERWQRRSDALMPTIAAEVEARVQAAANQWAAEELEAEAAYDDAAPEEQYARGLFARRLRVRAENLRAAIASPAPAPRTEEGS